MHYLAKLWVRSSQFGKRFRQAIRTPDYSNANVLTLLSLQYIGKSLRSPGIDSEEPIPPGWESVTGLLNRFTNTGSGFSPTQ